ncbi:MAG: hypothetical protein IKU35_04845 [Bacteroidaceae bacterium]|nr:hypothetical protein [Bacteroidaceae bacterium]MBR5890733.1 hypothetical protein [Bacteroidaceae bacterium]
MTRQQKLFWALLLVAAVTVALFEVGVMPKGGFAQYGTGRYLLDVLAIFLTIGLIPLALKKYSSAMARAVDADDDTLLCTYRRECEVRIALLFVVIMINAGLFYAADNEGALYCALVGLLAYVYSFPKNRSAEQLRENR